MSVPVSGEQVTLRHGELTATVASVGASLRELRLGSRPLIVPFDADELRPAHRGATIAPWPNRVVDGRYTWGGVTHQLPLTEVDRGHAIHGLTAWLGFVVRERGTDRAVLSATVEPQPGYPWRIRIDTRFVLDEAGLTQQVTATNLSDTAAPYGVCAHPYLVAGPGPAAEWRLTLPADRVLLTAEPRLIPAALAPVADDPDRFDFRGGRRLGDAALDHAFTGLARNAAGQAEVRLTAADGSGVCVRFGERVPWVQVYTGQPGGVAIEPMTCAPNAFAGIVPSVGAAAANGGGACGADTRADPAGDDRGDRSNRDSRDNGSDRDAGAGFGARAAPADLGGPVALAPGATHTVSWTIAAVAA